VGNSAKGGKGVEVGRVTVGVGVGEREDIGKVGGVKEGELVIVLVGVCVGTAFEPSWHPAKSPARMATCRIFPALDNERCKSPADLCISTSAKSIIFRTKTGNYRLAT